MERQLVRRRIGVAPPVLGEAHRLAWPQPIGGELFPVFRQVRLLGIDRRHAFDVGEAQIGLRREHPDLLVRPRAAGHRRGESGDRAIVAAG